MTNFDKNGYVIIREFLDPTGVATVSRYMEYRIKAYNDADQSDPVSKFSFYADPLTETILYTAQKTVEDACGMELYPTYSYARVYVKGDELKSHIDRPACEISVTCNVAINGEPWPIWCQNPGDSPVKCILNPGDAIVYRGCEVFHWREQLQHADFNVQFMLHYVNKHGQNASYRWDRRPAMGLPADTRRM